MPIGTPDLLIDVADKSALDQSLEKATKPFLRWAGSKRQQIARLIKFWQPHHTRYIEPFAGSACLFFAIDPPSAILGDINASLIEVFRIVRKRPDQIFNRLYRIRRDPDTYYRWRDKPPSSLDIESRVVRFIYLNRNCFNGIYRTNSLGEFNVPIGSKQGAYFTRAELHKCSKQLQHATFVAGDFGQTVRDTTKGDFVYLDPPFAVSSRRIFREYSNDSFDSADIPRLRNSLVAIANSGADFLVSYADCKDSRQLAKEWNARRFPIRRHVAGFIGDRRRAYEWLITNMEIPKGLYRN